MHVRPFRSGIDEPHVSHAEGQVIVDAFLHLRHPIVLGENLDTEKWRRGEDLLGRLLAAHHTDVRNPESSGFDLDSLFGNHMNAKLVTAIVKIGAHYHLQLAVIPFTHIPLQELSIDILSVRTIARPEVFIDRDQRATRHVSRIPYGRAGPQTSPSPARDHDLPEMRSRLHVVESVRELLEKESAYCEPGLDFVQDNLWLSRRHVLRGSLRDRRHPLLREVDRALLITREELEGLTR